ncbi:MAG: phage adaptor protein [Candidatus Heimdallarchaeaceae archaeon]
MCQDVRFLLGLSVNDTTSYPTSDITRNVNGWYRKANSWIWQTTGVWEYDDSNYTDFPIATSDLIAGQADYTMPSSAQKVMRVEVMDVNGGYQVLRELDQSEVGVGMTEFEETDGMPRYFDLVANSIVLYPAPSADQTTLTAGIKLYFSRGIEEFSIADTSTEPGFNEDFHRILSYGAALDYALAYNLDNKIQTLQSNISIVKKDLIKFYGRRNVAKKLRLSPKGEGLYSI